MRQVARFVQIIYVLYAIVMFCLLMLFVIPFALLTTVVSYKRGGNIIYGACKIWAICWYFLLGFRYKEIHEGTHDKKKAYIFVANHSSYLDIPQLMRSMHQSVRVLGKAELSKVPLFGIIYRAAVISVDRASVTSKTASMRQLTKRLKEGISVFIFPEGGFNELRLPLSKFYDGAFKMAISTQTPIQPVLFLDTAARIPPSSLFGMTPGRCLTVYLPEIPVTDLTDKDAGALKEKVFSEMEKALIKYKK
ncbi:1-acyl-sn-glycerol-3-phosphate acyltransferase [Arachidicoccus rhizosphaerae]|uniref:1-acyl-sn-glycerol-3-phosphate acyltransferase n=1 Tax=Arachidicoccus rhizosphaerae TaxID=551991 RepID=A0A1H4BC30_9BACT|nr:lysophospholipid acyltransferase family protein [Arachidicoccus rhizosphaerae]SEA45362.1 1-acyl-sn-glycerol-3-phosphate acyltransferase [Arachidicoccus rhizosphaerae]